jgi:hypothetical protein
MRMTVPLERVGCMVASRLRQVLFVGGGSLQCALGACCSKWGQWHRTLSGYRLCPCRIPVTCPPVPGGLWARMRLCVRPSAGQVGCPFTSPSSCFLPVALLSSCESQSLGTSEPALSHPRSSSRPLDLGASSPKSLQIHWTP